MLFSRDDFIVARGKELRIQNFDPRTFFLCVCVYTKTRSMIINKDFARESARGALFFDDSGKAPEQSVCV